MAEATNNSATNQTIVTGSEQREYKDANMEAYALIRDFLIEAYQRSPGTPLTITAVRPHLNVDVGLLMRVFNDLVSRKIINA